MCLSAGLVDCLLVGVLDCLCDRAVVWLRECRCVMFCWFGWLCGSWLFV